jgi:hypothetical protein
VNESAVASFNGAQIAYAERQVYARDRNFTHLLHSDETPRKASRLIKDNRFKKPSQGTSILPSRGPLADARLRADARGRDGGIREELAAGMTAAAALLNSSQANLV